MRTTPPGRARSPFRPPIPAVRRTSPPSRARRTTRSSPSISAPIRIRPASQALLDGLNRLQDTVGDTADGTSPAARIAALSTALQAYANAPSDASLGQAAVAAAQSVASTLNNAGQTATAVRNDADTAMAASVDQLNALLAKFQTLNSRVVNETQTGQDATDALDQRDALLDQISQEIGITVLRRSDSDMAHLHG